MTILQHPIRTTIFWGLICGLSFVPLSIAFNFAISWSNAICFTLWMFLAGYAVMLSRWSKRPLSSVIFPLLLLLLTVFLVDSIVAFFLLALIVVSWIRSGICFQKPAGGRLVVEMLLSTLAGLLLVLFTPGSAFAWALGVWLFFLVQALYFVFFEHSGVLKEKTIETDPFERASRQAEAVLSKVFIP